MSAYVFARLYWRSSSLVILAVIGPTLVGFYKVFMLVEQRTEFEAWFFPGGSEAVLLIVPSYCGYLVGSTIVEVYNGRFSWTLPGVSRAFLSWTVGLGLILAVGTALLYQLDGGEMSLGPAFAVAALVYGLIMRAQVSGGQTMTESRLGLLVVGLLAINTITSLGMTYPLVVSALALVGAAVALRLVFHNNNVRNLKDSPRRSLVSGSTMYTSASHLGELSARAKPSSLNWSGSCLGNKVGNWVRAFEYETAGIYPLGPVNLGANLRPLFFALGAVATPAFFSFLFLLGEPMTAANLTTWLQRLYEILTAVDDSTDSIGRRNLLWLITGFCVVAWGFELATPASRDRLADLRPKFLYPLSRSRHGQIRFWSCMRANVRYLAVVFAIFYGTILLCSVGLGNGPTWSPLPIVIYPLALLFLLTPFVQAFSVCYMPKLMALRNLTLQKLATAIPFLGIAFLASYTSMHWSVVASEFFFIGQVASVVATAVLIQLLLYRRLQRHFATADLTY